MSSDDWKTRFSKEIRQAEAARLAGNEGRARVCARRAAGIVVKEYLHQQGIHTVKPSAYELLRYLANRGELSPNIREITGHFLERVTPDHLLPVEADLIAEARWLADQLLEG